ncbi:MAG: iron chelate uptake ABC transporter family permease subunit, partial [Alistipes sp.]|nr:iron chelate uptake ABC transporter family permease subunit [Alistipes sp.]
MKSRTSLLFILLGLLLITLFAIDMVVGKVSISVGDLWGALCGNDQLDPSTLLIIRSIRLVKALVAIAAGAALAVSGLQMQTLFRNPLAGPFVLGISSGASLGVALLLLGAPLLGMQASTLFSSF